MSDSCTGGTWWGEWVVLRKEYTYEFETTISYSAELESSWQRFFSPDKDIQLIEKCLTKAEAEALAEFLNHASEVMEEDCG